MSATHDFIEDKRNESILIYINGDLVPRSEARISVFDSGFLLGDGFWESFRLHNGQIAFFDRHMRRLLENAKALSIDLPFGPGEIRRALERTVKANRLDDAAHLRLIVTRGIKKTPYQDPRLNVGGPTVVIIGEFKAANPAAAEGGIRLFTVHVRRGEPDVLDPKLHTLSKLNCILARIQATQAGADEALMLDPHGFVATCNSTNFFIVRAGEVWTSTGQYCLHGTTRGVVIDICRENGLPVFEKPFSLAEVYSADEAFVTGTFGGVIPAREADGRVIGSGRRGPVTERLQKLYRERLDRECPPRQRGQKARMAAWPPGRSRNKPGPR
jgi:branched-chain amino acid aminotransferase